MKLYGVALIPDKNTLSEIISFQNENIEFFKEPVLSLNKCIPHTSIIQCPFFSERLNQNLIDNIYEMCKERNDYSSEFGEIYYQPNGWYFLDVKKKDWMLELQNKILELMKPIIDYRQIKKTSGFSSYSKNEQINFLKYGYRYVGGSFIPHITLGRNEQEKTINDDIINECHSNFYNRTFSYHKIAIYEAGKNGSLLKIIASKDLK